MNFVSDVKGKYEEVKGKYEFVKFTDIKFVGLNFASEEMKDILFRHSIIIFIP